MPFYRPDRVKPSALQFGPGAVIPVPHAPDRRDAIGAALSGISRELADLPWLWPLDRTPRDMKLMIRLQERVNAGRSAELAAKQALYDWSWLNDRLVPRARA